MIAATALILRIRHLRLREVEWLTRAKIVFLLPKSNLFMAPLWMKFLFPNLDENIRVLWPVVILQLHLFSWPPLTPNSQICFHFINPCHTLFFWAIFPARGPIILSLTALSYSDFSLSTISSGKLYQIYHAHCIVHSFIHSFVQWLFIEDSLIAKQYSGL